MISTIFELSASLFDSILAVYFLTKFNYADWCRNYYVIPAILIPFGFQLFADTYLPDFSLLDTSIQFILSLIYAFLISQKHYFRAFSSVCIYKVTLIASSSSLYYFFAILFENFDIILYGNESVGRYLYIIIHKILFLSILQLILHFYNRESRGNILNGILTFSFSIITISGLSLTIAISGKIDPSTIRWHLFFIAVIFLFLNISLLFLLSQISKLQKRNHELKLINEKAKFEEEKYQEALNTWNSAEKIRHDAKHHMIAISGMLKDGKVNDCQAYLDKYLPQIENNGKFSCSGNTVIDYLLDSKLSTLENAEIIVTGSVGNLSDIQDTDLASLIGNILDNAIEAEKNVRDKRIELYFSSQNDNRIIICKNNIEASVLANNKELRSTKQLGTHGFGHQIIAEIVKKYNGLVHYFEENDMFGVQIILPINSNKT